MKSPAFATAVFLLASTPIASSAQVPAGYKGTPYTGTPFVIPGRINLAMYDLGGTNVSYNTNHTAPATSAPNFRTDRADAALIYVTSEVGGIPNNPVPDTWGAGPMKGMFYPGGGAKDYYIGATHPGDWVAVTVNVQTTGTYLITSTWSSGGPNIDYKIYINDLTRTKSLIEVMLPTTTSYHLWDPDDGPHMVQLTAGVQLLTFQTAQYHLNMDYLQFTFVESDGGLDVGNADAGYGPPPDGGTMSGSTAGSGSAASGTMATSGAASGSMGSAGASGAATSGAAMSGVGGTTGASSGSSATSGAAAMSGTVFGSGSSSGLSVSGSVGTSGSSVSGVGPSTGSVGGASGAAPPTGGGSQGSGCSLGSAGLPVGGALGVAALAAVAAIGSRRRRSAPRFRS
jgi:hypothetical protein